MQKLKNSLSAKVFLWVMCALTACSLVIYAAVVVIIPKKYDMEM